MTESALPPLNLCNLLPDWLSPEIIVASRRLTSSHVFRKFPSSPLIVGVLNWVFPLSFYLVRLAKQAPSSHAERAQPPPPQVVDELREKVAQYHEFVERLHVAFIESIGRVQTVAPKQPGILVSVDTLDKTARFLADLPADEKATDTYAKSADRLDEVARTSHAAGILSAPPGA